MITGPRMVLHIPQEPEFLQGFARVSIAHAALDHSLRMCIKTLADITMEEALAATDREGSGTLRDRIRKLARMRLGEGAPLLKLQAMIRHCEELTAERNRFIHSVIARLDDGQTRMQTAPGSWEELPTAETLENLALEIFALARVLNHERLGGFLDIALNAKKLPAGDGA